MGLLLDLGRLDQAGDLLLPDPDMAGKPVPPYYLQFYVRLAAARGDYHEADRLLADSLNHAWKPPPGHRPLRDFRRDTASAVGRVLMAGAKREPGMPRLPIMGQLFYDFWTRRWQLEAIEKGLSAGQERAETYLQRGWLALEAGRCTEARQSFQTVLDLVVPGERWIPLIDHLDVIFDQREVQVLQQLQHTAGHRWQPGQALSEVAGCLPALTGNREQGIGNRIN